VPQKALLLTPRKSCLEPVPQCPNKCNKLLLCGKSLLSIYNLLNKNLYLEHTCPEKCHSGECPPCALQSQTYCACGSSKKMVPCAVRAFDPIRCNKKCTKVFQTFKNIYTEFNYLYQKWLSCLRHKCHEVCCRRETHDCLQVCNKFLNCGRHKCDQLCHSGRCPSCLLASKSLIIITGERTLYKYLLFTLSGFDELRCECGSEVIYPPVPCGTAPPVCHRPCTREHPCGHTTHQCHSAETCPPCTQAVKKWCMGKHKVS
jgi:transcriptional repressor NF-X1